MQFAHLVEFVKSRIRSGKKENHSKALKHLRSSHNLFVDFREKKVVAEQIALLS